MDSEKAVRLDDYSATVSYVGYAAVGVTGSEAFWKIKRMTTSGTVLTIEWADGNEEYDNIWNNRVALTYV